MPEAALEAYEAALGSVCATVGFFRDQRNGDWRVEGVKPVGEGEAELAGALALAAGAQRVPARHSAGSPRPPRAGWLAPTPLPGAADRAPLRRPRHPSAGSGSARPDHPDTGCGPGVRLGRARLDPRLPGRSGTRCAAPSAAHSGSGYRVGHPGDGGGTAAASSRAGADIEPWSVRVARRNAARQSAWAADRFRLADGWRHRVVGPARRTTWCSPTSLPGRCA